MRLELQLPKHVRTVRAPHREIRIRHKPRQQASSQQRQLITGGLLLHGRGRTIIDEPCQSRHEIRGAVLWQRQNFPVVCLIDDGAELQLATIAAQIDLHSSELRSLTLRKRGWWSRLFVARRVKDQPTDPSKGRAEGWFERGK